MWEFLENKLRRYGEAHFVDKDRKFTYKEISALSVKHGEALKKRLDSGSKCAVLCENGLDAGLAILSCWYADMIPIPLSMNYGKIHCEKIIELTCPDILITDKEDTELLAFRYDLSEHKFIGNGTETKREEELEDIALIMCTSGTTGTPKGVMIGVDALKDNVKRITGYFNITANDTIMIARPLYHCAVLTGEFLTAIDNGLDIVFFDDKYNPGSVLQYAVKNRVTVLCGTPTLFSHISAYIRRNHTEHGIKKAAISGECLNSKTASDIRDCFPQTQIFNVYGLTEASPRVSWLPPEFFDDYPGSVGIALDDIEIEVVDDNYDRLPVGVHGKIMVRTPCIMKGYYRNGTATQKAIIDGWLYTGDIGYKDDNGFLFVLSRADDMIIKGGMNIYPKEIEDQVISIDQVEACVVYGKHADVGQMIAMDVVLKDSADKVITKKELAELVSKVLPSYQMPAEINIVESLKRNASGKVVRIRE